MQRPMRNLLDRVSGRVSLHMPALGSNAPFRTFAPYRLDTTELPVTDDLYRPSGAIAKAERLLAGSAGAAASLMLTGGSTAGVHTMLLYASGHGGAAVLPRNAHISALHVCAMAGITPIFAEPSFTPEGRLYTTAEAYASALDSHPTAAAFALHSDYYGFLGDLPSIAQAAHRRGRLLVCDEAHGAYFNWRGDVPNAGECGADLFVQSAHKTLPALTPGAWLHAMPGVDAERLRGLLRMVQTSSPSFLTLLALDEARAWMDRYGAAACQRLMLAMERFRVEAAALGYADGQREPPPGLGYDRLRLVLAAPEGGSQLQERLGSLGLDVEMSDDAHIVCILPLKGGQNTLGKLYRALRRTARLRQRESNEGAMVPNRNSAAPLRLRPDQWPRRQLPLQLAAFAPAEPLAPGQAIGRVSAVNVGLYPPGVAWLTAGDTVTAEISALLTNTPAERLFGLDAHGRLRCVCNV